MASRFKRLDLSVRCGKHRGVHLSARPGKHPGAHLSARPGKHRGVHLSVPFSVGPGVRAGQAGAGSR